MPTTKGTCGQYVNYTDELYVSVTNVADYGVRSYVGYQPATYCSF